MAKAKTSAFFCQNCGYESSKWMGQCPACREWNTFVEELVDRKALSTSGKIKPATEAKPVPLSAIKTSDEERISTSMPELDRVLGGGVVKGSLVLVGGDPGIGKSTLFITSLPESVRAESFGTVCVRGRVPAADQTACRADWHVQ